jgi:hypothetical protein
MDLVASSSRTRAPQSASGLPPRSTVALPYAAVSPSPLIRESGAGSASQAPMGQATQGTWRAYVSGGDRMGMGSESTVRSERSQSHNFGAAGTSGSGWPAQQADESGAWRASLGQGDLTSVVAESARLNERPQSRTAGTVSFAGYGQNENAWPPDTAASAWPSGSGAGHLMNVVASAGRSERWQPQASGTVRSAGEGLPWNAGSHPAAAGHGSLGQPAIPPAGTSDWPPSPGGGGLMSVVASSSRRSGQWLPHTAGAAPSAGQGLPWNEGPYPTAAGPSSGDRWASPPATANAWPSNSGGGDLMSVVAEGANRSVGQQFAQPGTAWPGLVGDASQPSMPFKAPGGASTSSSRKRPPPERFSAEEFDTLVSLVENGKMSAKTALGVMSRTDVPEGTARHWLTNAGMEGGTGSRHIALSVTQIEAASAAIESYRRTHGANKKGSVKAAYNAVNDGSISYPGFRHYFNTNGLTEHGQRMLNLARESEAKAQTRRA